jgi:hypothetical protein
MPEKEQPEQQKGTNQPRSALSQERMAIHLSLPLQEVVFSRHEPKVITKRIPYGERVSDDQVYLLLHADISRHEIAQQCNVPYTHVIQATSRLRKRGETIPPGDNHQKGIQPQTRELMQEVKDLKAQGYTNSQIRDALHRDALEISYAIKLLRKTGQLAPEPAQTSTLRARFEEILEKRSKEHQDQTPNLTQLARELGCSTTRLQYLYTQFTHPKKKNSH